MMRFVYKQDDVLKFAEFDAVNGLNCADDLRLKVDGLVALEELVHCAEIDFLMPASLETDVQAWGTISSAIQSLPDARIVDRPPNQLGFVEDVNSESVGFDDAMMKEQFWSRSEAGRYAAEQRWKGHLGESERRFEEMSTDEWSALHQQALAFFGELYGDKRGFDGMPQNADGRNSLVLAAWYLMAYTNTSYEPMNDYLRGGNPDHWINDFRKTFDREIAAATDRLVKEFDGLALPMPKDTVVYRGLNVSQDRQIKVGEVYEDSAFVSTSAKRELAAKFAMDWREDSVAYSYPVVMTIRLPKGYRAVVPGVRQIEKEQEVLLRPKTKFRVVEIKDRFEKLSSGDTYRVGSEWVLEVVK